MQLKRQSPPSKTACQRHSKREAHTGKAPEAGACAVKPPATRSTNPLPRALLFINLFT
jgi:hypothetical protein